MSNVQQAFQGGKAFIGFLTAGDPNLDATARYIKVMADNGADLIEIGIPFSDPVAEGPVIQAASGRALAGGATTDRIFKMVETVRPTVSIPLVFMTYMNPIYVYGTEKFFARCAEVGISGVIVPDVPFEEKGDLTDVAAKHGITVISLIAPTSEDRIGMIAKEADGFVYLVSSLGVTGMRSKITTDIEALVKVIRRYTDIPVPIGFGISTPEQSKAMGDVSDGVIVGSAIVNIIAEHGDKADEALGAYVHSMKSALLG